jgi:hypothetical protein
MTSLHAGFPRLHDDPEAMPRVRVGPPHGIGAARLTLFIGGVAYHLRPLKPDPPAAVCAFRLRKFDGTEYDVAQTAEGLSCDCPDFTFHREGNDPQGCKHIRALVECGLLTTSGDASSVEPVHPTATAPAAEPSPLFVPSNGQPTQFLEVVEHEAMGYRAWGTSTGRFLAEQMSRIAQLIRWTGATTPEDHEDRMEIYDRELRDRYYDQGYQDGREDGRGEFCPRCGHRD